MRIIAVANQKGGVGKTCTTGNLGAALVTQKKKVLLVDLDPQSHLTDGLGIKEAMLKNTVYELLTEEAKFKDVVIKRNGIDIIPSTLDMTDADMTLTRLTGWEFLLKEAMSKVKGYDYILIDCPPSLGALTINAFTFAKEVFITVQVEYAALRGMKKLLNTISLVKRRLKNEELEVTGIIATLYDARKNLHKEVVAEVKANFKKKLFKTIIRNIVGLAEAPSHGKTIFEYDPKSEGATDYLKLSKEIIKRG